MKNRILFFCLSVFHVMNVFSQYSEKITREKYIETYAELAMKEMRRSGVPASITLAQGLLESDNGNSRLAQRANNHFGIKCHSDWRGKRIYHDDDKRNECFRKYKDVYESYADHSNFLMTGVRYAFLFELDITDYKAWAKGLKKAGYATERKYADLLITIIEENGLHEYDLLALEEGELDISVIASQKEEKKGRKIHERNRIDYIVVEEGDNLNNLREELDLLRNELRRYNELETGHKLQPGSVLYLQPKRNRAARGNDYHTAREGETMYDISQKYGIKLEKLYSKNRMTLGEQPEPGQKIYLRKKKRDGIFPDLKIEEKGEEQELEFEFED